MPVPTIADFTTQQAVGNDFPITVTKPPGALVGDLLIIYLGWYGIGGAPFPTVSTPTDWTFVDDSDDNNLWPGGSANFHAWLFKKFAGASEPASVTIDSIPPGAVGRNLRAVELAVRGASALAPLSELSEFNPGGGITAPAITLAVPSRLLAFYFGNHIPAEITSRPVDMATEVEYGGLGDDAVGLILAEYSQPFLGGGDSGTKTLTFTSNINPMEGRLLGAQGYPGGAKMLRLRGGGKR